MNGKPSKYIEHVWQCSLTGRDPHEEFRAWLPRQKIEVVDAVVEEKPLTECQKMEKRLRKMEANNL